MSDESYLDPELISEFIVEAKEHLATIEPALLELEQRPDDTGLLDDIFRPMHSIKGAAGFIGLADIADLTHHFESLLDEMRKGRLGVTKELIDLLFEGADVTVGLIDDLAVPPEERTPVDLSDLIARVGQARSGKAAAPEAPPEAAPDTGAEAWSKVAEHVPVFMEEAGEIRDSLATDLVTLESKGWDADLLSEVFRQFHNLKGNSAYIGFTQMEEVTHRSETVLGLLKSGALASDSEIISALLSTLDTIDVLLGQVSAEGIGRVNIDHVLSRLDTIIGRAAEPGAAVSAEAAGETVAPVEVYLDAMEPALSLVGDALSTLARDGSDPEALSDLMDGLMEMHRESAAAGFIEIERKAADRLAVAGRMESGGLGFEGQVLDDFLDAYLELTHLYDSARSGRLIPSVRKAPPAPEARLMGEILVEEAGVSPEKVEEALAAQDSARRPLGEILTEEGLAEEEAVQQALDIQKKGRRPLGDILVEEAQVPRQAVEAAAKKQGRGPVVRAAETIRVEHQKLDALMNMIGELIINRNRFSTR